eukprot:CAMPEP_0198138116 /NCGR_PEP_ID=MMETSP1443-20131203/1536_1 /TAXON_ID=186043 /ORGANISM="Entomoneis sp., Strain CCMP2396" /LENGTH=402 /DNA_ID=CAMNT_0043799759 /DNA_START=123 /DNA_END=1331 /DNA_ORIENTATION=-
MKSSYLALLLLALLNDADASRVRGVTSLEATRGEATPTSSRRLKKKKEGPKKRVCTEKLKKSEYKFDCKSKNDDMRDKLVYSVKKSDGIIFDVKYSQTTETDTVEIDEGETAVDAQVGNATDVDPADSRQLDVSKTETSFGISCSSVIEYMPEDDNAAYNWDNDTIIQTIDLEDWGDFSDVVKDAAGVTSTFSVKTSDELAEFTFTISQADIGESISANSMKVDFRLTKFPWFQNDTLVALMCAVESGRKLEVELKEGPPKKGHKKVEDVFIDFDEVSNAEGYVPFGVFDWASTAEVIEIDSTNTTDDNITMVDDNSTMVDDNSTMVDDSSTTTEIEVVASSGTNENEIAFSFVGEAAMTSPDIFWDPEAGVGYTVDPSGSSDRLIGLGFVAGVLSAVMLLL